MCPLSNYEGGEAVSIGGDLLHYLEEVEARSCGCVDLTLNMEQSLQEH